MKPHRKGMERSTRQLVELEDAYQARFGDDLPFGFLSINQAGDLLEEAIRTGVPLDLSRFQEGVIR